MNQFKSLFLFTCLVLSAPQTGISFEGAAFLIHDASKVINGGLEQNFTSRALLGATFEVSLSEKHKFYIEGHVQRGRNGSEAVGDIQAYSNIDTDNFSNVYEVWVESYFLDDALRVKVGKIDANTEFAYVDHGAEFINSSMGLSPTISFLPTYPNTAVGVTSFYHFEDELQLSAGFFANEDNKLDEHFFITEMLVPTSLFTMKFGVWQFFGKIQNLENTKKLDNTLGLYFSVEGNLTLSWLYDRPASWYFQFGKSDEKASEITQHFGFGAVWQGMNNRMGDLFGIGITMITTSDFLQQELAEHETSLEVFYKWQATKHISLKPNLQFISTPASSNNISDALVFTLRTQIEW